MATAVGCGSATTPPTRVSVYLVRGDALGVVQRDVEGDRLEGALVALLEGPTDNDVGAGLTSAIPRDVHLLGLAVEGHVVTVDVSGALDDGSGADVLRARLAQLVFTATQFPDVSAMRLRLDGEPVRSFSTDGVVVVGEQTRELYEAVAPPPILVERPTPGETVTSPFRLSGSANVYEATFLYELVGEGGKLLAATFVTATCGSGCRGVFDVPIRFEGEGDAVLRVFERSAEDGAVIHLVEVPVRLG